MGYPTKPPPKPPIAGGDMAVSIGALILTVIFGGDGSVGYATAVGA
jgi:hypothetical protein